MKVDQYASCVSAFTWLKIRRAGLNIGNDKLGMLEDYASIKIWIISCDSEFVIVYPSKWAEDNPTGSPRINYLLGFVFYLN